MPGGAEGEGPTEGGACAHPEAREGRGGRRGGGNDPGILCWGSLWTDPRWVPTPGAWNPGWGGMGHGDASFSNMSSLSSGVILANPESSTVNGQLGLALTLSTSALTTVLPSPRSSAVASWGEVG